MTSGSNPLSDALSLIGCQSQWQQRCWSSAPTLWPPTRAASAAPVRTTYRMSCGPPRHLPRRVPPSSATPATGASSRLRWVLPDQAVDRLPEQVGVTDVAGVLVVQVDQETPDIGRLTGLGLERRRLVEPTLGDRGRPRRRGPFDGALPERVELLGGVVDGRAPFPAGFGVEVDRVPWRAGRLP